MKKRKVSIVGSVGLPASYGGWETLVANLAKQLNRQFDITVYCSANAYNVKLKHYNGVRLQYIKLNANNAQSIPYDILSIYRSLKYADTILILGVSGTIFLPFVRLFGSSKIIVNIDGNDWKRTKWGLLARVFLKLSEKLAISYADVLVADNKEIQNYIYHKYNVRSELIAYGGDHVRFVTINSNLKDKYIFLSEKYIFKVCRIEPENNLDIILEVFACSVSIPLVIVGNWSYSNYGVNLKERYQDIPHIYLLDPIYDQCELDVLRSNCYVYIHGHSVGGTNPSLVEAMSLGLAIIAYDVPYNRETTQNKAIYFKEKSQLISILDHLTDKQISMLSKSMSDIASVHYTWSTIANKYSKLF